LIPAASRSNLIEDASKSSVKASKMETSVPKPMTDTPVERLALLTAREAGRRVRRTEKTLANWRSQGVGPAYIKVSAGRSGRILYDAADVDRWISAHRVEAS
jgi:hypothetical protein